MTSNIKPITPIVQSNKTENITIMRRESDAAISKENSVLLPLNPYHKKLEMYIKKRNEIFNNVYISKVDKISHPKWSTIRLRQFYKRRKQCSKILVSAIVSNSKDGRFYAKVSFLNYTELGLLDTGASISCIGADLAKEHFSNLPNFCKCNTFVKTQSAISNRF